MWAAGTAGCDLGPFHNQTSTGPPIVLVSSNLATYTVDQPVVLSFNRFLDPNTVSRQSIALDDSSGNSVMAPLLAYDPVTLTVTLSNPTPGAAWLTVGQQYRVIIGVPSYEGGPGAPFGLQAIDGATLAAPLTQTFTAGAAAMPPASGPPTIEFCRDIFTPIFAYSCGYSGCHGPGHLEAGQSIDGGSGYARLGLDLSSPQGVLATALNQVADESNTGPLASVASQTIGGVWGVNMPIIAPGQPGNSWMMYKTLLATPAGPDAEADPFYVDSGIADAADPGPVHSTYGLGLVSPVTASEKVILANYVLGNQMPFPGPSQPDPSVGSLTQGDIERLSLWIAQGAVTPATCP